MKRGDAPDAYCVCGVNAPSEIRHSEENRMKSRAAVVLVLAILATIIPAVATAGWTTYFGPGTLYALSGSNYAGNEGYNYWTNQRVYRPLGHPFRLEWFHTDNIINYSDENSTSNPFYWAPTGYSRLQCSWMYQGDPGWSSIYPVTCEEYI
jgi:hypothetical protein